MTLNDETLRDDDNKDNGLPVKWYNSVHNVRPYQISAWPYP
jgi:hypothetical protein